MNIKKDELLEKIKKLNKEKPLKEGKEIQRVLPPADADAVEQHEEALEANKKRLDPKNYEKDVNDLIKDTASEESRYRHFDVVDRKELAKKINEAKEKKIPFKIARSNKEGFRYDFGLLKEEFIKKDAGNPEINKDAFNKAADIGDSLSEDYKESKGYVCLNVHDNACDPEECLANSLTVGELIDYLSDQFPSDSPILLSLDLDHKHSYNYINSDTFSFVEDFEDTDAENLDEELKIYTSNLNNFHPSKEAEGLWKEIKDANKIGDLEYALESLYPDGISDTFLDDMLIHEEEWIRDLIGVYGDDEEELADEEEPVDEFDDDDVEPIEPEESEEEDSDDVPENADDELEITDKEPIEDKAVDIDDEEAADNDKASDKEPDDKDLDDELDESLNKLADSFINSQFKKNDGTNCSESDNSVEEAIECTDDDDEVVAIDDSMIDDILGMPKEEKK